MIGQDSSQHLQLASATHVMRQAKAGPADHGKHPEMLAEREPNITR
jgi:hypothetical protein